MLNINEDEFPPFENKGSIAYLENFQSGMLKTNKIFVLNNGVKHRLLHKYVL